MTKEKTYGILAATTVLCIWGGVYVIKDYLLLYLTAFQVNFFNAMITTCMYGMICMVRKTSLKIPAPMAKRMLMAGIVGIMGSRVTCDKGISLVGGVTAALFAALIPVMCVIYDVVYRKQRTNKRTVVGVLVSVVGIYIMVSNGASENFSLLGYACLLLSNIAWIFYSYICADASRLPKNRNVMLFYQFLGSFLVLGVILMFNPVDTAVFSHGGVFWGILFLGCINGVVAYTCFAYATRTVGVVTTSGITNCTPIVAMILGLVFFNTAITWIQAVGVVLTVGAVSVVAMAQMEKLPES